ncbi:MAG: T9SS type A sorting domain-containing protein [Candidatus Delongbacteria bacterium]|nr:T9SS type A sorting domain-containing protein [Candidatus Delongbacteria bacterium]MBN2836351.1 T9SS type A sorting domain-containing protein [Candidatus Delongbacteria bacterium]
MIVILSFMFLYTTLSGNQFLNSFICVPNSDIIASACTEIEQIDNNLLVIQSIKKNENHRELSINKITKDGIILLRKKLEFQGKQFFTRGVIVHNDRIFFLYGTNLNNYIEMFLMSLDYDFNVIKNKKIIEFDAEFMHGSLYLNNNKIYFSGGYEKFSNKHQYLFINVYDAELNEIESFQSDEDKMLSSICIMDNFIYAGKYKFYSDLCVLTKYDMRFNVVFEYNLSSLHNQINKIQTDGDDVVVLTVGAYGDPYLCRFDDELNLLNETSFGGPLTDNQFKYCSFNKYFITCGKYNSQIYPSFHAGNANVTVLDSDFNVLNTLIYDDNVEIQSLFYDLTITENGRIFLVGSYNNCAWLFESDLEGNYNPVTPIEENIAEDIKFYNYPNPFNPVTNICFYLESNSNVDLSIYNLKGEKITSIYNGFLDKGDQTFSWKPLGDLSSGVYFSVLEINGGKRITKMIYNK